MLVSTPSPVDSGRETSNLAGAGSIPAGGAFT